MNRNQRRKAKQRQALRREAAVAEAMGVQADLDERNAQVKVDMKARRIDGVQYRAFLADRETVNMEERTVEVAFSSEEPVERFFGLEILDHGAGSIRLGRLQAGGAVLVNHNSDDLVGVVKSVEINAKEGRGRAVLRFGNSARASEILQDMRDGIRPHISVGYIVHAFEVEKGEGNAPDVIRATDWEPLEISSVPIPADPSVGVGRAKEINQGKGKPQPAAKPAPTSERNAAMNLQELLKKAQDGTITSSEKAELARMLEVTPSPAPVPAAAPAPTVNVEQERTQAREAETARVNAIMDMAAKYPSPNGRSLLQKAVKEGMAASDFGMALLEDRGQAEAIDASDPTGAQGHLGMPEKDAKRYSMGNAVRMQLTGKWDGVEKEAHDELLKRGLEPKKGGVLIPLDAMMQARYTPAMMKRVQEVSTPSKGGYLVQTSNMSFIDLLRNRMKTMQLGVQQLPGLRDNVAMPKLTAASTAYWLDPEGAAITGSEAAFGQLLLSPKTVGGNVEWTRQLALQSNPAIDMVMENDLNRVLGLAVDLATLHGTGAAGQPTGIANTAGVNAPSLLTADWAKVVNLETQVAVANADEGALALLTNATIRGAMKTREKATGYPVYLWENGEVNGYPAEVSNQVAASNVFFGDWTQVMLGQWGVLELRVVDQGTNYKAGNLELLGFWTVDVGVRQPAAFSVSTDFS